MTTVVLSQFQGTAPRLGPRLLAEELGVQATNVRAASGYLAGRPQDFLLAHLDFSPGGKGFVYRIVEEATGDEYYLVFTNSETDVVRSPIVKDTHERYYWAGNSTGGAWYNTLDRIKAGDPPYKLGLQRPPAAPGVIVTVPGTSSIVEDRRYVIAYIDEYGHESQPSEPAKITIKADEIVHVNWVGPNLPPPPIDPDEKPIEKVRIYRTVPGITSAAFFFVADVLEPDINTEYLDNIPNDEVALNEVMLSTSWAPPPANLKGLALMPNGFLAGFAGKDLWFSEPYRPHAWPPAYGLAVEEPIVGLGVFGSSLVILTTGSPYLATGTAPESLSLVKVAPTNACKTRASIISLTDRVVYAGEDGLTQVDGSGQQTVLTKSLITREQWQKTYLPNTLLAAIDGASTYIGMSSTNRGFELDLEEPGRGIIEVQVAGNVQAFNSDEEGRRPLLAMADDLYLYAESGMAPAQYTWTSKEFFLTQPVNMGACQIDGVAPDPEDYDTILDITKPLPPGFVLSLRLIIYADKKVFYDEVQDLDTLGEPFKLPSDMMAQVWQVKLVGNIPVSRVVLAETEGELATA